MLKNIKSNSAIAALLGALVGMQAFPALADISPSKPGGYTDPTVRCEPPVLNVPADNAKPALYVVNCRGAKDTSLAPSIQFSGETLAKGTPPYAVKASYVVTSQSVHGKRVGDLARVDQEVAGVLESSTISVAALASQFAQQVEWDADSGALSVEEKAGSWHVYTLNYGDSATEPGLIDAGMASSPVKNGRATAKVVLGPKVSRFSGKSPSGLPVVKAELRLRDGKLEVQLGETRVANQDAVQGALLALDRKPNDLVRAWALASRARFLGLDDEVRYAERKVAAFHPQMLEEFQQSVERITPYSITEQ